MTAVGPTAPARRPGTAARRWRIRSSSLALLACLACGTGDLPRRGDGAGVVRLDPVEALAVESPVSLRLAYEAAGDGIRRGGALRLHVWPEWGWTAPQVDEPAGPGFVDVGRVDGDVRLAVSRVPVEGALYDAVELDLVEGALVPGDRVEIAYRNATTGRFAGADQGLVLATDADGDGRFERVEPRAGVALRPGAPAHLWVVARGCGAPGGDLEARVSVLDRWGNLIRTRRAEGAVPIVRATDEASGLAAVSDRCWPADDDQTLRVYWGDVHGHAGWSDGVGTPEAYYRYARDAAGLDFAALTEHDAIGPFELGEARWRRLREITDAFDDPGRFVTLFGYEYTSWETGHLTVLSPSAALPLLSSADPGTERVEALWARLAALPDLPVLTIPHHSGGSTMATDWDRFDPRFVRAVEIFSVHGSSECSRCPLRLPDPVAGAFVQDALARGHRLSFLGSGDTHNGHPGRAPRLRPRRTGLAGVRAPELTREAIWEAIEAGRTFATTGARTVPVLRRDGDRLGFRVRAADQLARVDIVKNGRVVHRRRLFAAEVADGWRDPVPPASGDFYYLRVTEADGHMAWTSPIFVP